MDELFTGKTSFFKNSYADDLQHRNRQCSRWVGGTTSTTRKWLIEKLAIITLVMRGAEN